ncbi:MAG: lactonase family protein [Candidatus Poribacteria bacterium]|nr:lactonase family protein [Candidatus Poribacteria bacterium]
MSDLFVYVGTYTREDREGIYVYRMNQSDGSLTRVQAVGDVRNPSFVTIHPSGRYLYAVSEVADYNGNRSGAIAAYSIHQVSGELTYLNRESAVGTGPCHVSVDSTGKNVLVANYGGGNVAVLPINTDGTVSKASEFIQHTGGSVNPNRQKEPHAHSINLDPTNRFAFVADLGLDKVMIYRFDAERGKLTPNNPPYAEVALGAGPRHFAFHPTGRFAYVINEIDCTMTAFRYDAEKGSLLTLQTLPTQPEGPGNGNSTADVHVSNDGRFLYGSNRGHDTIVIYELDPTAGTMKQVGLVSSGGKTPRNFGIDPSGKFLLAANQSSDNIVVFKINQTTGVPEPTGHSVEVPAPVCVKFLTIG